MLCVSGLRAQRVDSFLTASTAAYLTDLDAFMTAGKRESAAELVGRFRLNFNAYTPDQQALVMAVTNGMLAQGMPVAPVFEDYLAAVLLVPFDAKSAGTFDDWHEGLLQIMSAIEGRRFKSYTTFLDFSKAFFGTGALRAGSGVSWYARSKTFALDVVGGEPEVTFDTLRLVGARKTDSITIEGTSGKYYPAREEFVGSRGRAYWTRLGEVDTYVSFRDYRVDVTSSLYEADSASMYNPKYFGEKKVLGSFSDKITAATEDNTGGYPRFTSYDAVLRISDLSEGLTYIGGFRMQGLTVFGDSPSGLPARLELRNEGGKLMYEGVAPAFVIRRGERVVGSQVRSTYYFGRDSITHPSVNARFDLVDRTLTLRRGDRAADRNPFYSSLQDVNFDIDEIKVFVDKDSMLLGEGKLAIAKGSTRADITSLQYFSASAYNKYQNIATYNPLNVIKTTAEREGRLLDGEMLAARIDPKFSAAMVQTLYFDLVRDGFIDYDLETKQVKVHEKLFHFVDAAQGKTDFDNLRVVSDTKETNATFDARTGDMLVSGVKNLELSRKQRVALVPTASQVVMRADRSVGFDGTLFAGFTILEGKDFTYQYAPHQVRIDSARYFDVFVPQPKPEGATDAPDPIGIASRIEHVSGSVLIDAPANKSGREDIPLFPSLQTDAPSYVFYDLPSNSDTAYTRDSFYFELGKFSFNSLDDFTDADVRFRGTMYSADIFPPYEESIYIREEDRSLGHVVQTSPEGWPTYRGTGGFTGELDLSNSGFRGQGTLEYLTAAIASDDITFLPEQMLATADNFDMAEERSGPVLTPRAKGRDVVIDWLPYRDSMYVSSSDPPFNVFSEGDHTLIGELILTPSGLMASGVHDWSQASITSELLAYEPFAVGSDTLTLTIKANDGSGVALMAENLNGRVDLEAQKGTFVANDSVVTVELTASRFNSSMNEFDWNIPTGRIDFGNKPGQLGSFVSIDPERDSLNFRAGTAMYMLNEASLEVGGVPVIAAADALIYPSDGRLSIGDEGEIAELTNARILADSVTKYHVIDSATVKIFGRKDYKASGYYRYDIPSREQTVRFDEIIGERVGKGTRATKDAVTRATGEIGEADNLYIDERTKFRGTIGLDASRPELDFDGFAKLDAPGLPNANWFSVRTLGVKDDLRLPYDLPKSPEGDDLHTGVFLSRETQAAYAALFDETDTGQDRPVFDLSAGLLDHRPSENAFVFGDSLRVVGATERGRIASVDQTTGMFKGSGSLDLGDALDYISIKSAGTVTTGFAQDASQQPQLDIEALLSVDFIIPEKLLNLVAADIQATGFDAKDVNYGPMASFLRGALINWTDDPSDTIAIDAAKGGNFVLPKGEPRHSFIFPRLPLVYNGEYQSFFSAEPKVDVAYVNGVPIHKKLEVYVEVKMPGSGDDRVYIYLKTPGETYYFFGYRQGILNVASSSPRFMESLEASKSKELVTKMDDGELYEVAPVNTGTANSFVARVKEARGGK